MINLFYATPLQKNFAYAINHAIMSLLSYCKAIQPRGRSGRPEQFFQFLQRLIPELGEDSGGEATEEAHECEEEEPHCPNYFDQKYV